MTTIKLPLVICALGIAPFAVAQENRSNSPAPASGAPATQPATQNPASADTAPKAPSTPGRTTGDIAPPPASGKAGDTGTAVPAAASSKGSDATGLGTNSDGSVAQRGFVLANGQVYLVDNGQAGVLKAEMILRVTPNGITGFDGKSITLPPGKMLTMEGRIVPMPGGLNGLPPSAGGLVWKAEPAPSQTQNAGQAKATPTGDIPPGTTPRTHPNSTPGATPGEPQAGKRGNDASANGSSQDRPVNPSASGGYPGGPANGGELKK